METILKVAISMYTLEHCLSMAGTVISLAISHWFLTVEAGITHMAFHVYCSIFNNDFPVTKTIQHQMKG
jgi:hypothetical protein